MSGISSSRCIGKSSNALGDSKMSVKKNASHTTPNMFNKPVSLRQNRSHKTIHSTSSTSNLSVYFSTNRIKNGIK